MISSVIEERKVLRDKSVLLGVTGGVAAYKAVDLIRRLRDEGTSVIVIMTEAAKKFITPLSLEIASQNRVYSDLFSDPMAHITLSANADIMVVAPATANTIGKFARGIADNLLTTCLLSFIGKVVIAPSMNWRMYENPVFQENLKYLLSRGVIQVGPEKGGLACGEEGMGRMSDISEIIETIRSALSQKDLAKEKILVTAGPTREYLDPIRFISNRSSGRMGYAIARAALRRGAEVILISGPSVLSQPKGIKFVLVDTTVDMLNAVNRELPSSTVLIMSAAVSDFVPAEKAEEKIEKSEELLLGLHRTPDIISEIGKRINRPFIIGFAAETGRKIERARRKLKEKDMDMIIFNDITETGSGFDVDTNSVVIIDRKKEIRLPLMSKDSVADAILDRLVELRAK
ncbi:MAG: bifunctional phosphopantothenoylcysteine decarboxylase/phosphopantothenate--cysteine ligase CoaBC [Thermodesulfovibrionales bacterium]|nr:bifunctional phosphopantothenoylcysteine decarboxylase/phosphopantothenate--cysteine ligase CoaBC [Thermodesulfovibrionales bacterium]